MIAVDTNVLVHAHRADLEFHDRARRTVTGLAEGRVPWAIPWPVVHEFLSVVTRAKVFKTPSTMQQACDQIDAWLHSPTLRLLSEAGQDAWPTLRTLALLGRIQGAQVHDARIAALCMDHGVDILLTADRDFGRFPRLVTRNPLVD